MDESTREVVVVTGASAGVGRAVAREFGRRKARVGLLARGTDGLAAAAREIEEAGGQAMALPVDVSNADQVEQAAASVEAAFGPIDIWVNNAMTSVFSPFWELTAEEFRRVTEVTYLGVVHGTMSAVRRMLERDRGTIVQVGSALAYRSIPLQSAYCGAKHAIVGFTDSLRCELDHRHSRVHLTVVHLPAMNTPQFGWVKSRLPHKAQPVPPIYEPEVAARAIYWAAHHKRRQVDVGLPTVEAIFGNKIVPGLLDRYLGRTGFAAQQTDELRPPDQPYNLWKPLPGDRGAHGTFGDRSRSHSVQTWLNLHRTAMGVTAGLLVAAGLFAPRLRRALG
ncbi:MAG TPA: SDR family oxidoreductase [Polyangia bacterium]|nr:SDR family oxidoreductase [Polyangia bacterium]